MRDDIHLHCVHVKRLNSESTPSSSGRKTLSSRWARDKLQNPTDGGNGPDAPGAHAEGQAVAQAIL